MLWFWTVLCFACTLLLLALLAALICFFRVFYSPTRKPGKDPSPLIDLPDGEIYEAYREQMENWVRETRAKPQRRSI